MYLIRILIIGDTGVGKTSVLLRFHDDNYVKNQKTTIGVDYKAKEVMIGKEVVKLQIWDTAGQERFRSMTAAFYSRAQGVVLTFDVSQRDTFLSLPSWIRDVKRNGPTNCLIVLCANKTDVDPETWAIKREEFRAFATDNQFLLFETSAASGTNVNAMFSELASQILSTNNELAEMRNEARESLILFENSDEEKATKKSSSWSC